MMIIFRKSFWIDKTEDEALAGDKNISFQCRRVPSDRGLSLPFFLLFRLNWLARNSTETTDTFPDSDLGNTADA